MSEIVLVTLNARFIHASVGLRYLFANLGQLQARTQIAEFEVAQPAREIAEAILDCEPVIVGFGVYIWNVIRTREVIALLKKVRPELLVVIGGPEVSHEHETQSIVALADYLITGEADLAFAVVCRQLLAGERPATKVISAGLPSLAEVQLPYRYYSDSDIAHRVIYVEASRGCPFTCEFCLSSLDIPVRQFDHERVLLSLEELFQRGARTFKFVDRTFNLNVRISLAILSFFLERMEPGLFVHFEMVPDRFPPQLREVVKRFPPGSLQLEIGVQTLNPEVSVNISRRQDVAKLQENLSFLRTETSAYLHVDLIAGLPGETLQSFAEGFDALVALDPHEIQVGILKRLRGTAIVRHDREYQMRYSDEPPYEVVCTRDMSFRELQRIGRFARYWDLVANSGNFVSSKRFILASRRSAFEAFMLFSEWLFGQVGRRASINLRTLTELVFRYVIEECAVRQEELGPLLVGDYIRGGRRDLPKVLKPFVTEELVAPVRAPLALKRQQRAAGIEGA